MTASEWLPVVDRREQQSQRLTDLVERLRGLDSPYWSAKLADVGAVRGVDDLSVLPFTKPLLPLTTLALKVATASPVVTVSSAAHALDDADQGASTRHHELASADAGGVSDHECAP